MSWVKKWLGTKNSVEENTKDVAPPQLQIVKPSVFEKSAASSDIASIFSKLGGKSLNKVAAPLDKNIDDQLRKEVLNAAAYETIFGAIPKGYQPELEPVSPRQNQSIKSSSY